MGLDQAYPIDQLATKLRPLLTQPTDAPIYLDLPPDAEVHTGRSRKALPSLMNLFSPSCTQDADLLSVLSSPFKTSQSQSDLDACLSVLATAPLRHTRSRSKKSKYRPIKSLQQKLDTFKMIKSPAEINLLRKAADITAHGHKAAIRLAAQTSVLRPQTEHDVVHAFESACQRNPVGFGSRMGYVPVCAAGSAALTVHYTANDRSLQAADQMVLLDAGYEYAGYVADITRTFPSGNRGEFTSAQRDLYEAVLGVQRELIGRCIENRYESLSTLHRASCQLLRVALSRLGFDLRLPGALERLYPHYIGHPVGTDLHDTPTLDRTTQFVLSSCFSSYSSPLFGLPP